MESFGLFDLLKSLLLFKGEQPVPPSSTNQSVSNTAQSAPTSEELSAPNSTANADGFPSNNFQATNAYVDFLNRHDERAKRHRNK